VFSVFPAKDVACVLDYRMLEAATGAKKRHLAFPSVADCQKSPIRIAIWTGWNAPDAAEWRNAGDRTYLIGRYPPKREFYVQRICRVLQGKRDGLVCGNGLIVISDEADRNSVSHR